MPRRRVQVLESWIRRNIGEDKITGLSFPAIPLGSPEPKFLPSQVTINFTSLASVEEQATANNYKDSVFDFTPRRNKTRQQVLDILQSLTQNQRNLLLANVAVFLLHNFPEEAERMMEASSGVPVVVDEPVP